MTILLLLCTIIIVFRIGKVSDRLFVTLWETNGCNQEICDLSQALVKARELKTTPNRVFIPEEPEQLMPKVLILKSSSE